MSASPSLLCVPRRSSRPLASCDTKGQFFPDTETLNSYSGWAWQCCLTSHRPCTPWSLGKTSCSLDQPPPDPSEPPGLRPQRCGPWVHSWGPAVARVGQGAPEHSLANHCCRVSTAQNLNPLFSLQTGIKYENAACKSAHTAHTLLWCWQRLGPPEFRKREMLHCLCLQICRKRCKPQPWPGIP